MCDGLNENGRHQGARFFVSMIKVFPPRPTDGWPSLRKTNTAYPRRSSRHLNWQSSPPLRAILQNKLSDRRHNRLIRFRRGEQPTLRIRQIRQPLPYPNNRRDKRW